MPLLTLFLNDHAQKNSHNWRCLFHCSIILFSFIVVASSVHASDFNSSTHSTVINNDVAQLLSSGVKQLPEKQVAISADGLVYAQYTQPTSRYKHGILGDSIEAEQLMVIRENTVFKHTLTHEYVFEDIKPRLFDVNNDGELEVITIRSHASKGAGIMIYKIINNDLVEYAWVTEIGLANRWLNIVAIYDLDSDGIVELAWIQTPHIGGVLKVAEIKSGKLDTLSEVSGFSNHAIGQRNLCLSVLTRTENSHVFYVPTQNRRQITGFKLADKELHEVGSINRRIDFSYPLMSQYIFTNIIPDSDDCQEFKVN